MGRFSISDIEKFTGVKAHTLRIWEQRYNMVIPKRTDTNIRYYDDDDLKYLLNVSILLNCGYRISKVAGMGKGKMEQLVMLASQKHQQFSGHSKSLSTAMISMDEDAFNRTITTCILQMGLEQTILQVIFPFMDQVGLLWMTGSIHPAHEHFVSNLIKQKLYVAIDGQTYKQSAGGKRFLLYLPDGEAHEMGLLYANYMIRSLGHKVIYLGQMTPEQDICGVFDQYNPEYVFTSVTCTPTCSDVNHFISKAASLWCGAKLVVAGSKVSGPCGNHPDNVIVLKSLDEFLQFINSIS